MERILIIGNGFDLAHKLPTRYNDFLYFCCKRINKNFNYNPDNLRVADSVNSIFQNAYGNIFDDKIRNNSWISYFIRIYDENRINWIDFETEIKNVCINAAKYENNEIENAEDKYEEFIDVATLNFEKEKMKEDLSGLILILDAYLNSVNSFEIPTYSRDILDFYPTKVISFNYTDTYKKVYDKKSSIEYIHGKLSTDKTDNSIVLGFNSLEDNRLDISFSDYIKYFQMVSKDVTTDIFNEIENLPKDENIETMIFGHSMDVTDQNILKAIIEKSNIVYVMFRNNKHKAELIKNVIALYGEQKFMELCLRKDKKIRFIKQKDVDGNVKFDGDSIFEVNRVIHNSVSNEDIQNVVFGNNYTVCGVYGCISLIHKIINQNTSYSFERKSLQTMIDAIMNYIKEICSNKDNYLISYPKVCDIVNKELNSNNLERLAFYK